MVENQRTKKHSEHLRVFHFLTVTSAAKRHHFFLAFHNYFAPILRYVAEHHRYDPQTWDELGIYHTQRRQYAICTQIRCEYAFLYSKTIPSYSQNTHAIHPIPRASQLCPSLLSRARHTVQPYHSSCRRDSHCFPALCFMASSAGSPNWFNFNLSDRQTFHVRCHHEH